MVVTITGSGTSQGVPVIGCECKVCLSKNEKDKRLRSSIHILYKQKSIVIDTGPDFRQQMINNNIKNLDAVLFTHEHKDHVAGLVKEHVDHSNAQLLSLMHISEPTRPY